MKSKVQSIKLSKEFPCLMEYRIQGEVSVGIYLVNETSKGDEYSVCLVAPADDTSEAGEMYFKEDLNPKEWFFLPAGTKVVLTN